MAEELIGLDQPVLVTPREDRFGGSMHLSSARGRVIGYKAGRGPSGRDVTLYVVAMEDGTTGQWYRDEVKART